VPPDDRRGLARGGVDAPRALQLADPSAGEALATEAGEGVRRIQGCEQDPLPLRSVMVGQPGRRDRLPDASLAAREDVTHLGSLSEQFRHRRDGRPPHNAGPNRRSCETFSIMSIPRGSRGYIGRMATTFPANLD